MRQAFQQIVNRRKGRPWDGRCKPRRNEKRVKKPGTSKDLTFSSEPVFGHDEDGLRLPPCRVHPFLRGRWAPLPFPEIPNWFQQISQVRITTQNALPTRLCNIRLHLRAKKISANRNSEKEKHRRKPQQPSSLSVGSRSNSALKRRTKQNYGLVEVFLHERCLECLQGFDAGTDGLLRLVNLLNELHIFILQFQWRNNLTIIFHDCCI